MAKTTCSACQYWVELEVVPNSTVKTGGCHLHPPSIVNNKEGDCVALFPRTFSGDFCGDGEPVQPKRKSK